MTNLLQHITKSELLSVKGKTERSADLGLWLGFPVTKQDYGRITTSKAPTAIFLTKDLIVCCFHCVHKSCKGLSKNGELNWVELNWRQTIYFPLFIDSWGQDSDP